LAVVVVVEEDEFAVALFYEWGFDAVVSGEGVDVFGAGGVSDSPRAR